MKTENKDIEDTGLRGVVVAGTGISSVDGEKGELIYRGYNIIELAQYSNFEETCYLLLYGNLPKKMDLEKFKDILKKQRSLPEMIINSLKIRKRDADPMNVLQSIIPSLVDFDDLKDNTKEANIEKSINIIAKTATLIAYWDRIRKNLEIKVPNEDLDYYSNFLYMLKGEIPDKEISQYFDRCLILHAEHSFNASTFTARVVASTRAHIYECVSAAMAALSGDLHGGANTEVMKMLIDIGNIDNVEKWIKKRLDSGQPIMGIGHAVYKTVDPRAKLISEMLEKLSDRTGDIKWLELIKKVEKIAIGEIEKRKNIRMYPNVDFYSGLVYHLMGIDNDLFTPIFAMARNPGWCAHIIEEKFGKKPVLYRPNAEYVGKYCGPEICKYISIEDRK